MTVSHRTSGAVGRGLRHSSLGDPTSGTVTSTKGTSRSALDTVPGPSVSSSRRERRTRDEDRRQRCGEGWSGRSSEVSRWVWPPSLKGRVTL